MAKFLMPRVKLIFPENFLDVKISIPVRITDINYGDHVGNDALVSIIHEARIQFLLSGGFTELNIEGTVGLIMSDLIVEFKNESFYKDVIDVKIAIDNISNVSFELIYKLYCLRDGIELTIANAKTTMICFDYERKKIANIPSKLLSLIHQ